MIPDEDGKHAWFSRGLDFFVTTTVALDVGHVKELPTQGKVRHQSGIDLPLFSSAYTI